MHMLERHDAFAWAGRPDKKNCLSANCLRLNELFISYTRISDPLLQLIWRRSRKLNFVKFCDQLKMKIDVLFIGNSHTYLNYMPQMLLMLVDAENRGFELIVDQCTGEGASLEWHWKNPVSRGKIHGKAMGFCGFAGSERRTPGGAGILCPPCRIAGFRDPKAGGPDHFLYDLGQPQPTRDPDSADSNIRKDGAGTRCYPGTGRPCPGKRSIGIEPALELSSSGRPSC